MDARAILLLLALATPACSPAPNGPPRSKAGPVYALRSNVAGASLVKVAELPSTTALPLDPEGNCADRFVEPTSAAGKLAARKGWRVAVEAKFHQFEAVLIARGWKPLTSGRCSAIDSNIAFFEGDRLIGVLYPKGKDPVAIDWMEVVNDHLRVWSTDPAAQGQANLQGATLGFDRIAGSDQLCNGKYRVPAMFGRRYSEARRMLSASWSARPSTEEVSEFDRARGYRRRFPEVDSCAGTGYAECRFTLTASDGVAKLSVVTLGEDDDPVVSSYSISCDGKQAD